MTELAPTDGPGPQKFKSRFLSWGWLIHQFAPMNLCREDGLKSHYWRKLTQIVDNGCAAFPSHAGRCNTVAVCAFKHTCCCCFTHTQVNSGNLYLSLSLSIRHKRLIWVYFHWPKGFLGRLWHWGGILCVLCFPSSLHNMWIKWDY